MALIDTIAQFLCRDHVSECMSSVQQQSPDPLVQMTFLAFFPTVFLILLIYFMSEAIIGTGHKGLRTLLGIAVYVFIVFYGWYHFALIISKFWFVALIILGGLGIFVHRMSGGGAGLRSAGGGAGLAAGGLLSTLRGHVEKRIKAKLSGEEDDIKGAIKTEFEVLKDIKNQINVEGTGPKEKGILMARFAETMVRIRNLKDQLDSLYRLGALRMNKNEIDKIENDIRKIAKDVGMNLDKK